MESEKTSSGLDSLKVSSHCLLVSVCSLTAKLHDGKCNYNHPRLGQWQINKYGFLLIHFSAKLD